MTRGHGRAQWDVLLATRHLDVLVDDIGILQHADGSAPNLSHGYCVDDVARLLIVAAGLHRRHPERDVHWRMMNRALSFLIDAEGGGVMRNFMSIERRWLDEPHMGDHVGRTVWGLGELLRQFPDVDSLAVPARDLLDRLLPALERQDTIHEWAYSLLGLSRLTPAQWGPRHAGVARDGCRFMLEARSGHDAAWPWFEDRLTYDNARLAQGLIAMGHRVGNDEAVALGAEALGWFWGLCDTGAHVDTIGNGWLQRRQDHTAFTGDEQPIDVGGLTEACVEAFLVLQDETWAARATMAFTWFLGVNRLGLALFDVNSGGCRDGLGQTAVNNNQGAESTLAFLQAGLALEGAGTTVPAV
ncbi:hypothetical protein [Tessaracoccus antarcticus]|uniref:Glycosyltransferase n=1 Tax=Tessaracoccus antarcticus TaxID=2479848 RepID=A0A3M0G4X4_9ACTN|nr:hypothetical protein [Tessaracoccus antarcticus]RMB59628.1 hypothetical protein EAX62_07580 [Tessaracoccus antarcticus]